MKARILVSLIMIALFSATQSWSQSIMPTVVGKNVSLVSGNDKITYIELTNTHSTYDDISLNQFRAQDKNRDVLWKIQCIGLQINDPYDKITIKNEKGQVFKPMLNIVQTAENARAYNEKGIALYDGPATTFFLVGPDDSRVVQLLFGQASSQLAIVK